MKKHLAFSFLFFLAAFFTAQAQSFTYAGATTPTDAVQYVRKVAGQLPDVFNSRDKDYDRDNCDKCQNRKKAKKHDGCQQRGNHYGKHKNHHGKHSCSCDHHCCQSGKRHDRDDDDRCGGSRRDRDDDDRRYGENRRNRDDDDRRYDGNRRNGEGKNIPRTGQGKPSVKVKNPAPTPKPAPKRPVAKRKETPRPLGTRQ